jgi:hypothetical protein
LLPTPSGGANQKISLETELAIPDVQAALLIVDGIMQRHNLRRLADDTFTEEDYVRWYANGGVRCKVHVDVQPILVCSASDENAGLRIELTD